ncbi:MAG: signal peptidase II [bacterium]|nr:signal peptidase II [bacterium]
MTEKTIRWPFVGLIVLLVIVLDRVTKRMIIAKFSVGEWYDVFPGLSLTRVHNRGIAFSLFNDGGPLTRIILHLVIVVAILVITYLMVRQSSHTVLSVLAFGLVLGGAIGNLVDRVVYGHVVDFINVWIRLGGNIHSWPNFNVADSAISCGAGLLILHELRSGVAERRRSNAPDAD